MEHFDQPKQLSSQMERKWTTNPYFNFFAGKNKIQGPEDVAFIFQALQQEGVEHFFCLHVREDKSFSVQWTNTGITNTTFVDHQQVIAGALHFNASTVYLVHNHPSGSLKPSEKDIELTRVFRDALSEFNIRVEHIILNLDSGKFAWLVPEDNFSDAENMRLPEDAPEDLIPLTIHSFTRHVFSQTYFPETVGTPHEVAEYVSSLRFGTGFKLAALFLNSSLSVVANYMLPPYIDDLEESFKDILTIAPNHGTVSVVLYGNLPITGKLNAEFEKLTEKFHLLGIKLNDYVQYSNRENLWFKKDGYSYNSLNHKKKAPEVEIGLLQEKSPEYNLENDSISSNFTRLEKSLTELSKVIKTKEYTEESTYRISRFPGTGFAWGFIANHDFPESWKPYELKYHESLFRIYDIISNDLGLDKKQVEAVKSSFEKSAATSFYTPDNIAETIVASLKPLLPAKPNVLEPSCGSGAFIRAIANVYEQFNLVGIEKDILTSMVLKHSIHNDFTVIRNESFEDAFAYSKPQFDLIISNFPFGDYSVFDKKYATSKNPTIKASIRRIHNYFAVKSLELLPEDGVLCFITTNGFTNSVHNKPFRELLISKADLICNIGLPNTLFKGSNTAVGTNLIVIKKNSTKEYFNQFEQSFIDNDHEMFFPAGDRSNVLATSVSMEKNQYGQLAPYYTYDKTLNELSKELADLITRQYETYKQLPQAKTPERVARNFSNQVQLSLFDVQPNSHSSPSSPKSDSPEQANEKSPDPKAPFQVEPFSFYRYGWLVTDGKQVGEWKQEDNGILMKDDHQVKPIEFSSNKIKTNLIQLLLVRDSFLRLYYSESSDVAKVNEDERQHLNELYNQFKKSTRSFINHRDCKGLLSLSKQSSFFKNLERMGTDGKWYPVELFSRPIFLQKKPKDLNAEDALAYSLNQLGKVSLPLLTSVSGKEESLLIESLKNKIFYNPDNNEWEEKSFFLCGKISDKLLSCETAIKDLSEDHPNYVHISESIDALKNALPKPIAFEDISIQLGTVWLPIKYYSEFAQQLFKEDTIEVIFLKSSNQYVLHPKNFSNSLINTTYALKTDFILYDGLDILELTMNDDLPHITKVGILPDGKEGRVPDVEKTVIMKQKMEEMRQLFYTYLLNLPKDDKEEISFIYNDLYNSHVNFMADGSHLQLNDLHFFKETIYPYQKNSVWHIIANRGGIIDLLPGAGKSLIMFVAAHEMKKMGLVRKPLILCLKANVQQMVNMYQLAYPHDNILYPNEKDFSTKNRENILYQMANNDWDCIFLTHEQFSEIPPTPEVEEAIVKAELDTIKADLQALDIENAPKRQYKELMKKQENLKNRLRLTMERIIRKKDIYTYDKLGIDKIFVDESHFFKNLTFSTRHSQISGIGNPTGSQRAFNLLIAIRTHQILHNTHLTTNPLEERNTLHPNRDFGASFLTGTTISNSIAEMYLLFKYMIPKRLEEMKISNFDAWAKVFAVKSSEYEFAVTTEFKIKTRFRTFNNVPELSSLYNSVAFFIHPTELQLEKPQCVLKQVVVPQTPEQEDMTKRLIRFAKDPIPSLIGLYHLSKEQAKAAKMLICTDIGKKMTLDMRMVDPKAQDHPNNKLSACAANLSQIYKKYNDHRGTQLVFLDTGTPGSASFDAYAELKRKFVDDYLMPAHEIAFIHDATSAAQKDALLQKFNQGLIRILIGSTQKMGTGVNCQERVVAMHSLDVTWTPAGMDQRTGRGARQGNILAPLYCDNKVDHFVYCTEKSLDIFRFQLLATKQSFIDQIKRNKIGLRTIDELSFDENSALSYGQFIATLTGNPLLMENQKLIMNIAQLEAQRKAFYSEQYRIRANHDWLIEELEKNKESLRGFENDKAFLEKSPVPEVNNKRIYTFILRGTTYQDIEAFGAQLRNIALDKTYFPNKPEVIGHFRGWDITAHQKSISLARPGGRFTYNYTFDFSENNEYNCGRYPIHCLQRIDALIGKFKDKIEQNKKDIQLLQVSTAITAWPKEAELSRMKDRKNQIEIEIEASERKNTSNADDANEETKAVAAPVKSQRR